MEPVWFYKSCMAITYFIKPKNNHIMKKTLLILTTIILLIGSSCQEKVNFEKEQELIKAVLEKSSQAWLNRNFEDMKSAWVNDAVVVRLSAGRNSYSIIEGWDKQATRYKTLFENNPEPFTNKEVFSNHRFKIYPSSAFVIYDMELRNENNELLNERIYTAFLEKEDGWWKLAYLSTLYTTSYARARKRLETSETYHKLNPDDIESILTDDFIGRNEKSRFTWTKENHQNFWTENKGMAQDSIYRQLAQGPWVATMFMRKMNWKGKDVEAEVMHFKRFEDGKIAEIFEFGDSKQRE